MRPRSASDWKRFYARERAALGESGLDALFDHAPSIAPGRALVFPHTRLSVSGSLIAAAARAVVRSGCSRVVALGVLHGARVQDAQLVERARVGDPAAVRALRGVHTVDDYAAEEFSLDNFVALVERAARLEHRAAPVVIQRYPFLVGADPASLPGLDELVALTHDARLVATTDAIHDGVGYGATDARDEASPDTLTWAQQSIEAQLNYLARGHYESFLRAAADARSDFRDVGPVLATLLRPRGVPRFVLDRLELVPYDDVLATARPTWVAAALAHVDGFIVLDRAFREAFADALAHGASFDALVSLVREHQTRGLAPEVAYETLFELAMSFSEESDERDRVYDVLDRVVGWCSPQDSLY